MAKLDIELIREMEAAGVSAQAAEAIIRAIDSRTVAQLATKLDLAELRAELTDRLNNLKRSGNERFARLEMSIDKCFAESEAATHERFAKSEAATNERFARREAGFNARLTKLESTLTRWFIVQSTTVILVVAAWLIFLRR